MFNWDHAWDRKGSAKRTLTDSEWRFLPHVVTVKLYKGNCRIQTHRLTWLQDIHTRIVIRKLKGATDGQGALFRQRCTAVKWDDFLPNGHFSVRNLTAVPSMPSAESVGKAAKSWVVMAGWTENDPWGSAGPSQGTEVCNRACAGAAVLRTGLSPPQWPLTPVTQRPHTWPVRHCPPQQGSGHSEVENAKDRDKTEKITYQLLPWAKLDLGKINLIYFILKWSRK